MTVDSWVDTLKDTSKVLKFTLFVITTSLIFQFIAISRQAAWAQIKDNNTTIGIESLWYHCDYNEDLICCQTLDTYLHNVEGSIPGWINGCRAFQIMGIVMGAAVAVVALISMTCGPCGYCSSFRLKKICSYMSFTAAVLVIISVIIYDVGFTDARWKNCTLKYWFFTIAAISGGLYVCTGLLIQIDIYKTKGQGETRTDYTQRVTSHITEED